MMDLEGLSEAMTERTQQGWGEWEVNPTVVLNADADFINGWDWEAPMGWDWEAPMGWDWEAPMARYVNYGTGSFTVANVSDPADAHALSDYFLI